MTQINLKKFGKALRGKRGECSLRETARETGIGAHTLSRLERGGVPNLATYAALCAWLGVSLDEFVKRGKSRS